VVLEYRAVAGAEHPLEVEELLAAEVALAQEAVLAEQAALEISLLAEQVLLDHFIKEPQAAEQVLQVLEAQETALQVELAVLVEAEAAHQALVLAVEEEMASSISITKHCKHLVKLDFTEESHDNN
jgi:hypothetical protein